MNRYLPRLPKCCCVVFLLIWAGEFGVFAQALMPPATISGSSDLGEDYTYFDLACNVGPFSGYFQPERWERTEDHAFQVSTMIEGADSSGPVTEMTGIVFSGPRSLPESWSIEVPASGYLSPAGCYLSLASCPLQPATCYLLPATHSRLSACSPREATTRLISSLVGSWPCTFQTQQRRSESGIHYPLHTLNCILLTTRYLLLATRHSLLATYYSLISTN